MRYLTKNPKNTEYVVVIRLRTIGSILASIVVPSLITLFTCKTAKENESAGQNTRSG